MRNRGVAFGLFADGGVVARRGRRHLVLALLVFFATHRRRPLVWLPTGLLLGGAAGNLIDRLDRGYVTDFIDIRLGRPSTWPTSALRSAC